MKAGWNIESIEDVAQIVNGGTPKTGVGDYWDGQHQWITPAEMGKRSSPYVSQTVRMITDQGLKNSSANILPINSVVLSSRAPIGHLIINEVPMAFNQGCKGLIPTDRLHHKFLYYFLLSSVDLLNSLGTGATFKELSGGKLKSVKIPVPSIFEQKGIVSILDEAFAGIDQAIANTEKNLASARELFENYTEATFNKPSANWEIKKLHEVAIIQMGQSPPGETYNTSGAGVPLINGPDEFGGKDPLSKTQAVKFTTEPSKMCEAGDIILCVRGSTTGRMNIAGYKSCIGRGVALIRGINDHAWVTQFISFSKAAIFKLGTGATFPNVSSAQLKEIKIPFPSPDERHALVQKINESEHYTKSLVILYSKKLRALQELKQSLLQKAFSGELTANVKGLTEAAE